MKNRHILSPLISGLLAAIGLWILIESVNLGLAAAGTWLQDQGGSADTQVYLRVLNSSLHIYQILGGILLGTGLFHLLSFTGNPGQTPASDRTERKSSDASSHR